MAVSRRPEMANRLSVRRPKVKVNRKQFEGTIRRLQTGPPGLMDNTASMKSFPAILKIPFRLFLRTVVLASLLLVMNGLEASAQSIDLSTDNVTVDLSVIGDSGAGPVPGSSFLARPFGGGPRTGLLVPRGKNPVSQLHVRVPGASPDRIKLRPPGTKKKKPAKRVAKKKVKKPAEKTAKKDK